jgi:hypothetical protein
MTMQFVAATKKAIEWKVASKTFATKSFTLFTKYFGKFFLLLLRVKNTSSLYSKFTFKLNSFLFFHKIYVKLGV